MKTANPRIPSPFDTAGMFAALCPHSGLIRKNTLALVSLSHWTGAEDGQLDVWYESATSQVRSLATTLWLAVTYRADCELVGG